jgi:hypothetical protein
MYEFHLTWTILNTDFYGASELELHALHIITGCSVLCISGNLLYFCVARTTI